MMNVKEQKIVERISREYTLKETTKLDELKQLDRKVMKKARVFAYTFGTIGSLIMGLGMTMAMQVILAEYNLWGILIGCLGILMVSINYLMYKKIMTKNKNKYADQILKLSEELLNQ